MMLFLSLSKGPIPEIWQLPLQVNCGQTHLLWRTAFRFDWKASFGNFFLSIVSVLNMFLFDIWGICAMISSIKVASIKPEVSQLFRCLLISLRLSDSDKNFLTLCITVVLLFFFFWLLLVQFAHHVPLQVEGRIECFRAFTTQMFVSHPHFFLSYESAKTNHKWSRMGILLQRGNAAILGNRIPALPGALIDDQCV